MSGGRGAEESASETESSLALLIASPPLVLPAPLKSFEFFLSSLGIYLIFLKQCHRIEADHTSAKK